MAVLKISNIRISLFLKRGFKFSLVHLTPTRYDLLFGLACYWEKTPLSLKEDDILYFFIDALNFDMQEGVAPRGLFEIIRHEKYTEKN